MKSSLIRYKTKDGAELQGIIHEPSEFTRKALIHVHGHAGNFYENRFLDFYAGFLCEKNVAFLAFNNRGHDYINDILFESDSAAEYTRGGSAYEKLEWSLKDIEASMLFLKDRGYEEIILQGHSLGCNKVVNYLLNFNGCGIEKCVLLAPCDIVGYEMECDGEEYYRELCVLSENQIAKGKGSEILSFGNLTSAYTFRDFRTENCKADIFRYRLEDYIYYDLRNLKAEFLVVMGDEDEYIRDTEKSEQFFMKNIDEKKLYFSVIKGATHNFFNHEKKLLEELWKFIS